MDTNQESKNSLDIYISELGEFYTLSRKQEKELFADYTKWRDNKRNASKKQRLKGKQAYEKIIYHNLRLVVKIAKDYRFIGLDLEDLINEGNCGLVKAVERFDTSKDVKFCTYASFWIKQYMRRSISNNSRTIRLPVGVVEQKNKINKFIESFKDEHGYSPSINEIKKKVKLSSSRIALLLQSGSPVSSLDSEIGSEGDSCQLKDLIKDDTSKSPSDLNEYENNVDTLNIVLSQLPKREKSIMEYRYGLNDKDRLTLEEIGEKFGVTRERIRQLETVALRKVKYSFNDLMRTRIHSL